MISTSKKFANYPSFFVHSKIAGGQPFFLFVLFCSQFGLLQVPLRPLHFFGQHHLTQHFSCGMIFDHQTNKMNKPFSLGRRSSGSIGANTPVSCGSAFGDQLCRQLETQLRLQSTSNTPLPADRPITRSHSLSNPQIRTSLHNHGYDRKAQSATLYTLNAIDLSTSPMRSSFLDKAQLMRKDSNASSDSYQSVLSSESSASSYCHLLTPSSGALDEAGEGEGWNEFLKLGIDPITTQSTIPDHCKATSKKGKSSLQSKFPLFFPKEQKSSQASLHNSRRYASKSEPVTPAVEKSDLYELKEQPMAKKYGIWSPKESLNKSVKFDTSNLIPGRESSSSFKYQTRVARPSLVKKPSIQRSFPISSSLDTIPEDTRSKVCLLSPNGMTL